VNKQKALAIILLIVKKLLIAIFTLFVIATLTFWLLAMVPGDPMSAMIERLNPVVKARMMHYYGYDRSNWQRYLLTMKNILHGDFGESVVYAGKHVSDLIREHAAPSVRLGIQQVIVGVPLGLGLGILAAVKKDKIADRAVLIISTVIISVPTLVLCLLVQEYVAGKLGIFPVVGWPRDHALWFGGWQYTILPTFAGALGYISSYSRLMRNSTLDTLGSEFLVAAKSRGASKFTLTKDHLIKNSFIPIINSLPITVGFAITGTFWIENIFNIPGLGRYFVESISKRDLPTIMGTTIIIAAMYIALIFITDLLYTFLDPRIKIYKLGGNNNE
jgi:oligopeptide transport system permease protein